MYKISIGLKWNPKTNEFEDMYYDEYIIEQEKELKFWKTVAKVSKVDHKKKKAQEWSEYLEENITNATAYVRWCIENNVKESLV